LPGRSARFGYKIDFFRKLLESLLYQVRPRDPVTFAAVPLLLLAIAAAASYIPARRATKVDPMVVLRHD